VKQKKNMLLFAAVFFLIFAAGRTIGLMESDFPLVSGPYLGQSPPGNTPELFAPGILSTCTQHSSAYFTPDGREVFFSRFRPKPSVIMHMKEVNGRWTQPSVLCEGLTPGLSPDGNTLIAGYFSLEVLHRTASGWSKPKDLGPLINFQRRQDVPSMTNTGILYFTSEMGRNDGIYRAEPEGGGYKGPEKLDLGDPSTGKDHAGYIAPDESYLILISTRPGYGISDLFITFRRNDGSWSPPKNMGPRINTSAKEGYPFVTVDGKYLFFMSNRVSKLNAKPIPDGPGNVYWMDAGIIDELR
jgi:hypothetical protein